jgi:hypothetical protein
MSYNGVASRAGFNSSMSSVDLIEQGSNSQQSAMIWSEFRSLCSTSHNYGLLNNGFSLLGPNTHGNTSVHLGVSLVCYILVCHASLLQPAARV